MIDRVVRTVRTILNKDASGYVTPEELDAILDQVQLSIFDSYFEDNNRDKNRENKGLTNKGYGNLAFNTIQNITSMTDYSVISKALDGKFPLPSNYYTLEDDGVMNMTGDIEGAVIEPVTSSEIGYLKRSSVAPSTTFPVYEKLGDAIAILPRSIDKVGVRYLRYPKPPKWTYRVIGGSPIFDQSNPSYQDFEINNSEFTNIVIKTLFYFGINLREDQVIKVAESLDNKTYAQENTN
jgi:hypothetical protein